MLSTITVDCENPKKNFDEIALKRCSIMAHQSLNPEEFEAFMNIHNVLIKRRKLQNKPIT